MRRTIIAALLAMVPLAGCTANDTICPGPTEHEQAFIDAEEYLQDLEGKRVSINVDGTSGGDPLSTLAVLDPTQAQMHLRVGLGDALNFKFKGPWFSQGVEGVVTLGRDLHPQGAMQLDYQDFLRSYASTLETSGASFIDELTPADMESTCGERGGEKVLMYTADHDGDEKQFVVEREGMHRPLLLASKNPAKEEDFTATYAYGPVNVVVDLSLEREPYEMKYRLLDVHENDEGGLNASARITAAARWVKMDDVRVDFRGQAGTAQSFDLAEGVTEFDEGRFEYRDVDANQVVSEDDQWLVDLSSGYDVFFYDKWAEADVALSPTG